MPHRSIVPHDRNTLYIEIQTPLQLSEQNSVIEAGAASKKAETNDAPKETIFDESLKCTMCMDLCSRPITVGPYQPHCFTFDTHLLRNRSQSHISAVFMPSVMSARQAQAV